ncbi:MAG: hypothetical protein IT342_26780 [Candidatus Melainabacteria bacterium]|nr:hypothetical protein [Candidatus Melainabacteria bacterium]
MSFERKRRISLGLTSAYFLASALTLVYIVGYHAMLSCCGTVLLALTAPLLLYGALAHFSFKDFRLRPDFVDPADFGMSIDTANFIRAIALLLPLPFLAYGWFFASGMSWLSFDGSPASIARTYAVVAFDEKIFGHRMAQRELRRAARVYVCKHNYSLAQQFITAAINCAEEHTPNKPSRSRDMHYEAGKIAARAGDWSTAESEFSLALHIAKDSCGCDANSRIVKKLNKIINNIHTKHLTPAADHSCSLTFEIDPGVRQFINHHRGAILQEHTR